MRITNKILGVKGLHKSYEDHNRNFCPEIKWGCTFTKAILITVIETSQKVWCKLWHFVLGSTSALSSPTTPATPSSSASPTSVHGVLWCCMGHFDQRCKQWITEETTDMLGLFTGQWWLGAVEINVQKSCPTFTLLICGTHSECIFKYMYHQITSVTSKFPLGSWGWIKHKASIIALSAVSYAETHLRVGACGMCTLITAHTFPHFWEGWMVVAVRAN